MNENEFKNLFSNLCCSQCRNDFEQDALNVINREGDILICNLTCTKCGKDFGQIIFNFNKKSKIHHPLEIIDGPAPISADDVLNAHEFINNNL